VPGIDFSDDPLLQGRLFSYLDTQLSRLGSPNFHQLPVNAPKCPFANQQRDAKMQVAHPRGRVAYEPSTLAPDRAKESPTRGFRSAVVPMTGDKVRARAESFADHYSQARMFFRSQTPWEQAHIASALVFELSKVDHLHVRVAMVGHLRHIDEKLASRVAKGLRLGEKPASPRAAAPVRDMPPSPALQTIGKMKDTLEGRCVGILIADGSDAATVAKLTKAVTAAGATVKLVAPHVGGARFSDGSATSVDGQLAGTPSVLFDAVAVILSETGARVLSQDAAVGDFLRDAFGHLKAIAVDRGGRALLQTAGVDADAGVVDAREVAAFVAAAKTRQWDREASVRTLA
jgi:catalase